ncbi:MAG: CPBP family intramembrane metalloprotease [Clostridia bacterium]|nr:CPBP family intramembrane metalloprotease [Clostridia bacterium]
MNNSRNEKNQQGFLSRLIGEPTPEKNAGLTYSVAAIVILFLSLVYGCIPKSADTVRAYLSFMVAPIAFLFIGVWYFCYTKTSFKTFVKAQNCPPKYYLIAVLLQIGLLSLGEVNTLFLEFLEKFGYEYVEPVLPSMNGVGFIGVLFVIAVLPAIMEDFFFRGIQLEGIKTFGTVSGAILSGALFALFHQNPAQTVYQFICGAAFALVAIKAGSFLPTALAHFINNAYILVLHKYQITSFSAPVYAIILVTSAICLIVSLGYLLFIDRQKTEKKKGKYGGFFLCASVGIAVFALSWVSALLA